MAMDKIHRRLRDATDPHMTVLVLGLSLSVPSCVPHRKVLVALRSVCVANSVQLCP